MRQTQNDKREKDKDETILIAVTFKCFIKFQFSNVKDM